MPRLSKKADLLIRTLVYTAIAHGQRMWPLDNLRGRSTEKQRNELYEHGYIETLMYECIGLTPKGVCYVLENPA